MLVTVESAGNLPCQDTRSELADGRAAMCRSGRPPGRSPILLAGL